MPPLLFGKRRAPEFVDLSCPLCGHTQRESSLVISTNCRSCNTYLKIEKGIAIPPVHYDDNPRYQTSPSKPDPAAASPATSAATAPSSSPEKTTPATAPQKAKKSIPPLPTPSTAELAPPLKSSTATSPIPSTPLPKKKSSKDKAQPKETPVKEPQAAASIPSTQQRNPLPKKSLKPKAPPPPAKPETANQQAVTQPTHTEEAAETGKPVPTEPLAKVSPSVNSHARANAKANTSESAPPSPSAPERYRPPENSSSEVAKSKISPLINREKKRSVKCFECHQEHKILADSKSALCPHCGAYIGLKDYDIRDQDNSRIQTRGNVFVHKKGFIRGITVHAHNLTIEGEIQGGADCTGDFIVRKNGKINGAVTSDRVIIERRAEVDFLSTVEAREVIIDGHVTGSVSCKRLTLRKRATLDGDLTVASLSVEEGAKHTGKIQMTGLL